jgi:hypothetical protein
MRSTQPDRLPRSAVFQRGHQEVAPPRYRITVIGGCCRQEQLCRKSSQAGVRIGWSAIGVVLQAAEVSAKTDGVGATGPRCSELPALLYQRERRPQQWESRYARRGRKNGVWAASGFLCHYRSTPK